MRCQQALGGSGSLVINSSIKSSAHYIDENGGVPFCIGDIAPNRTFIHVLGDKSLDILMSTLDTISDFVAYLNKKEKLFRSDTLIIASGEEDLLAYYLTNMNEDEEHDFVLPSHLDRQITHLFFDEGHWEKFNQSPERQAQISANNISYIWDALIETFGRHIVEDTQYFTTHTDLKSIEPLLRLLARESRFRRRSLSAALYGLIKSAPRNMRATRYCCSSSPQEPYYVFLTLPQSNGITYEEYREIRRHVLMTCCSTVKLKFPDARHIIGVATEAGCDHEEISQDAIYLDVSNWTNEDASVAQEASEKLDILKNPEIFTVHDREYPIQKPTRY